MRPSRLTGLAVLAACGVAVAGATGMRAARVTLTDTTVTPTVVRVGVGSAVVWTNRGAHRHRVASTTGVWGAFVLGTGASHSVTFRKAGAYPYRVDGKRPGVVLVLASLPATSTGTGSFLKPYHYRVTVHVVTHFDRADADGKDSNDVEWRGTWPDVVVKVGVNGADITAATTALAKGRIDAQDAWSHSDPKTGGPCSDTYQDSTPAQLSLNGNTHRPTVHFVLGQLGPSPVDTFLRKVAEQQQGECKGFGTSGPQSWNLGDLSRKLLGPSGLTADPDEGLLMLSLESRRAPTPYPLDLLAHHDSFQFQTEPAPQQRTSGGETVTGTAEVTVAFTARN